MPKPSSSDMAPKAATTRSSKKSADDRSKKSMYNYNKTLSKTFKSKRSGKQKTKVLHVP